MVLFMLDSKIATKNFLKMLMIYNLEKQKLKVKLMKELWILHMQ